MRPTINLAEQPTKAPIHLQQGGAKLPSLMLLEHLFVTCSALHKYIPTVAQENRDVHRQVVANAQYFQTMLMAKITELDIKGMSTMVDGIITEHMCSCLHDWGQGKLAWKYQRTCYSILYDAQNKWRYATSSLFIILPSDLDSWNDSDPSTHKFRLHFLCNIQRQAVEAVNLEQKELPQHVHLANHPGYSLKQPQEFFQLYGDYVLRVLQMVKHGYFTRGKIPSLDTFEILWNCDPAVIGSNVTKDTIGAAVDKAIAHLQDISPPKWTKHVGLTRCQIAAIKGYLAVQDGEILEGGLHRVFSDGQSVKWACQPHAHQYLNPVSLEEFRDFVSNHGGHCDVQQSKLKIELESVAKASQFLGLLKYVKHAVDISIKLAWTATRLEVNRLCKDIAKTKTVVLELDGISFEILPQDIEECMGNFFDYETMENTGPQCVILVNYPHPQERCIFFEGVSLRSILSPTQSLDCWVELRSDLERYGQLLSTARTTSYWTTASKIILSTLKKYGFLALTTAKFYCGGWSAVFDLQCGALSEVRSLDMACPQAVLFSGSLRTLELHLCDLNFDQAVFRMALFHAVESNISLQELKISHQGLDALYYTEKIFKLLPLSSRLFRLTLLDRMRDAQARVIAQLFISTCDSLAACGLGNNSPLFEQHSAEAPVAVAFSEWDCDNIFIQLSDYTAWFLDLATQRHPSALTSFTLDVSALSEYGFTFVQRTLSRSNLEHLKILCSPFDSNLSDSIARVLDSVQWSMLKSLVLSGEIIDQWVRLLSVSCAPCLQLLSICGTGSDPQKVSHQSALNIHRLLYSNSLIELHFENALLIDNNDWLLIVENMDLSLVGTIGLCKSSANQLMSIKDAVDPVIWSFGTIMRYEARLVWPSLTPDFPLLSRHDLVHVPAAFALYTPVHVHFVCIPFDLASSELVDHVLASARWSALESLVLSGDSIDQWVQLLPTVDTVQLLCLTIRGTGSELQKLSYLSISIIQNLISSSPLVEFTLENIQMQDKRDWMLIIESIDFSFLEKFVLCKSTVQQLLSNTDAVGFLMSKIQKGQLEEMSAKPTLKMFTLDFSSSQLDLSRVLKSISQYRLDNLRLGCHKLSSILSRFLALILDLLPWRTLEGLVLFGDNIDEWIPFFHSVDAPQLSRLYIHETGTTPQKLSKLTVQFLETIAFTSPQVRFHFENVILQNTRDWQFIIERMDPSFLETFVASNGGGKQISSSVDAMDLLLHDLEDDQYVGAGEMPELFILDGLPSSQGRIVGVLNTLSRNNLEGLYVVCRPVDSSLSKSLAQVLGSINWIALQSLVLSDENIDEWLQLWPSAVSIRLRNLTLHGEEPALQELSHPSVLFIQRLISMSPMEELRFKNVQLQDKRDWMSIVESLDLSTLKTLGLCERSARQFNSSGDAVDLYKSMFKSTGEMEGADNSDESELDDLDMLETDLEETDLEGTDCEDTDVEEEYLDMED